MPGLHIAAGDGWLDQGANILLFGPPGGGKSHLAAALLSQRASQKPSRPASKATAMREILCPDLWVANS